MATIRQEANPDIDSAVINKTVTAFSGTLAETAQVALGNPCSVQLLSRDSQRTPAPDTITQCRSWETGVHEAQVRCWGVNGKPIALCGHGLLSCAGLWLPKWGEKGALVMGQTSVLCHTDGNIIWLGFTHARAETVAAYDGLPEILGTTPLRYAHVGGDEGYLIAELAPDAVLQRITPPGRLLEKITNRALIVTCASSTPVAGADALIHYRYFAPQHGSAEDSATGSAMRILAKYWHDLDKGRRLVAYQCSPRGGLLNSYIEADTTWVGGLIIDGEIH